MRVRQVQPDTQHLLSQVGSLRVLGCCDCGCPSIYFNGAKESLGNVAAEAFTPDQRIEALVFAKDGLLTGLELAWTTDARPTAWPAIEELVPRVR